MLYMFQHVFCLDTITLGHQNLVSEKTVNTHQFNILWFEQNDQHFVTNIFRRFLWNENICMLIKCVDGAFYGKPVLTGVTLLQPRPYEFSRPQYINQLCKWREHSGTEYMLTDPESKVHGANMGPTWVLSAPDGPYVGPMNLAIRICIYLPVFVGLITCPSDNL